MYSIMNIPKINNSVAKQYLAVINDDSTRYYEQLPLEEVCCRYMYLIYAQEHQTQDNKCVKYICCLRTGYRMCHWSSVQGYQSSCIF